MLNFLGTVVKFQSHVRVRMELLIHTYATLMCIFVTILDICDNRRRLLLSSLIFFANNFLKAPVLTMTSPLNNDSSPSTKPIINQTGQCLCGSVKFRVKGTIIFNELCHCRACGRARGMTPVHVVGVQGQLEVQQGDIKTIAGLGSMTHTNCAACGCGIYQRPQGEHFYAVFPTTFQLESPQNNNNTDGGDDMPSCLLPDYLQPTVHVNYENRLMDFHDSLPKYKSNFGSSRVNDIGQVIKD